MKRTFTVKLLVLIAVSLMSSALQGVDGTAAPKNGQRVVLPDASDPRYEGLVKRVPKQVIKDESVSEVIGRVSVARMLRSSVMIKGDLSEKRVSFRFEGGTLRDFLESLCAEADASIEFGKFATEIRPKN